ncbi:beta-lactamase/transpeptidase-like protein [Aspergillus carlsbadensis]|nr:beta-lactamase/transpeptidase-like protein [Aspergillus carlsbadensis]
MSSTAIHENPFERMERSFLKATEDGTWPGAIVAATNRRGTFRYAKAFGKDTCDGDGNALEMNSIMAIASMTKLLTSIAALQLVESELIGLDDDVSPWIPTLAAQPVLSGWDVAGRPLTHTRKNKLTLRNLLTHSSGAGYDMGNSDLARFTAYAGREVNSGATVDERFGYPLLFEPGVGWEYGAGIDWVGQVIERRTGQTLETYMRKHIWEPLGIERMSFWPGCIPDADGERKHARMCVRDPVSGWPVLLEGPSLIEGVTECFGGQGVYASMEDFLKVLHSILADDGKLLTSPSTAMMLQPQLSESSREALQRRISICGPTPSFIGLYDNTRLYDWGLGGMLCMEDEISGRCKGSLFWSGRPNLFWFIDRESDVCGVLGTQLLPPGDPRVSRMIELFESSVFAARQGIPGL